MFNQSLLFSPWLLFKPRLSLRYTTPQPALRVIPNLADTVFPCHRRSEASQEDPINLKKMQTSTYPRASELSDNKVMRHLSHRSVIACKLGTAIALLLHSMFGCTWAHGCGNNHRSPITVGSQAHSSCQHAKAVAPQEAQVTHPACEQQHDDTRRPTQIAWTAGLVATMLPC